MKPPVPLACRFLVALMMAALGAATQAASNCPSPEACLAKALEKQWDAYQSYIEGAWAAYREDRAFYEQARKLGDAELIDMTQKRLSASEPVWRYARAMAEAIAAPGMSSYLESSVRRAQSQVDLAQQRMAREQRFLDGYLHTSGPAREAAQRDMQGYAKEQDDILYVAAIDTVKTVASYALESALAMARTGQLGPYGETARQLGEQAMLAGNSVQSGLEVAHARNHGDTLKACLEAAGAAGTLITAGARIAQAHALEATLGGAEVYAGLLSITLDTVLLLQNAVLMEEARQRSQELGLHEQRFGERVHKAEVEVARLTRLRDHAQQQVDQGRRIAALLESTKEQP
jgi:hypothetical protein